jgi:WbqC-like protein family
MRAGVIQSCYIPWRGYFDFIDSVDVFVIYDDVQYSSGSWRNRNQVKTRNGLRWLSVPVAYRFGDTIDAVNIGRKSGVNWQESHRLLLQEALAPAPNFADAIGIWEGAIAFQESTLSALNLRLIEGVCQYLGIGTRIVLSRDYQLLGSRTARLIDLLRKLGATTYLSGPSAQNYLEEDLFKASGIGLEYKSYEYPPYLQLWGDFAGSVTVLDLIANCGRASKDFLKSRTPDFVAVTP